MTESTSTWLALVVVVLAVPAMGGRHWGWPLATGLATGMLCLLRPDFLALPAFLCLGLLAVRWLAPGKPRWRSVLSHATVLAIGCGVVIAPWVVRNRWLFDRPIVLTTPFAVDGVQPIGYSLWLATWHVRPQDNFTSLWPYVGREWTSVSYPERAFDGSDERLQVEALLARLVNQPDSEQQVDDRFAELARVKRQAHVVRSWLVVPGERLARLWFSTRSGTLPLPHSRLALQVQRVMLGGLNLSLLALAVLGGWALRRRHVVLSALLVMPVYRSSVHAFFPGCEPRYVIQAYPPLLVLAAFGLLWATRRLESTTDR